MMGRLKSYIMTWPFSADHRCHSISDTNKVGSERSSNGCLGRLIDKSFEEMCQLDDGLLTIQLDARSSSKEWLDLDDITTNFGLIFWLLSIGIIDARGDAAEKHVDGDGK